MSTSLLIILLLLVAACLLMVAFRSKKMNRVMTPTSPNEMEADRAPERRREIGFDLEIYDDNGVKVLESREIERIPARAHRIDSSGSAIRRAKHMAGELLKGAASVPNKTIEIVFKPEIHQGLADGAYTLMRTKGGEVLADAVDTSGKIVGKGRQIQGGKARQLASGAFQLVSIAVAQSHLADIERSLSAIKDSITEVLERQENEDKAKISGAFDYLREISIYMKELRCPDELAQQKRNTIEGIIKDSYSWRNKLEEDMSSLINQISNLRDADTFGTGDTFQRLKSLIERIEPLLARRKLLLNLASAVDFVTVYLDPARCEFSKIDVHEAQWNELIKNFDGAVLDRESALMGKAFWNSNETLQLRKDKLRSLLSVNQRVSSDQKIAYQNARNSLEMSMSRLIDPSGNVRLAISFDERGDVSGAAIL